MAHFSEIVIIGGGIAGPALAIALYKHGIRSTIYEGRSDDHSIGGSMVITANGSRVLDNLGIYKQVYAHSFVHESGSLVNIQGDSIGKIVVGSEQLYGYPALRLYRNSLRRELLAEAAHLGIEIRYNMRCVKVQNEKDGVVNVLFENGQTISADLVVGFDGINSCVRDYVAPGHQLNFTGQICIIGFAKNEILQDFEEVRDAKMILGTEGSFAIMPADGVSDTTMFFSTIESPDRTKEEWHNFNMNKQGLKDFLQDPFAKENWPGLVRKMVKDTPADTFYSWPFQIVEGVDHWVSPSGRVVIAGDAAHAIPPNAAQGGSMALEDVETLAITISSINNLQTASLASRVDLFAKWEGHRKSRIEQVTERTKAGGTLRKATRSESVQAEKENALKADKTEDDLQWLYGYDGKKFDPLL